MHHPNRYRIAAWGGVLCIMTLGIIEATRAQQAGASITLDSQQVTFSNVPSGGAMNQTIHVTSSTPGFFVVNTSNTASWLSVTPDGNVGAAAGTPVPLILTALTGVTAESRRGGTV